MTSLTLGIGGLLTVIGIVAYLVSDASSVTALIPSLFGALLLIIGLVARNPAREKLAFTTALVVAALGILGSLMNVAQIGALIQGTAARPSAVLVSTIMFVLLIVYAVAAIRWLRQPR